MEKDGKFVKGMVCGAALTLACMALTVNFYRLRLNWNLKELTNQTAEQETELDLNTRAVGNKIAQLQELINESFLGDIDTQQVEDAIYSGMLEGLDDPYSEYYSAEELQRISESSSGEYSGIGVTLTQDPDTGEIYVVMCFPDTPAVEAGLQPGDVIWGVNGEEIGDMSLADLVARIKSEPGEKIILNLHRDGETLEAAVERRDIQVPTVSSRMLEEGIGYIRILEFDSVTVEQFEKALKELKDQGMEKLLVDVRDNPGGVLQVVCDILDELLPEGLLVYTEDKDGQRTEHFSDEEHQLDMPMAVLINENSASASEIFAGAIHDFDAGTLVGTTTFGKGVVQRVYDFTDGTGVKLTIAKYYTPDGTDIHEKGIEPDVQVELSEEAKQKVALEDAEDLQLQEALRILKEE